MKHFYRLYKNNIELMKTAALFLKEGIDAGEYCFWAAPKSVYRENFLICLKPYIELIDHYIAKGQIRAVSADDWYLADGVFDIGTVVKKWKCLYDEVLSKGFTGLRVVGDASWAVDKDWDMLIEYERIVHSSIKDAKIKALCLFDARKVSSVVHISNIVETHEACYSS
ncbi:MAG: MEDS domain-containing protein [Candidatus Omnitrophota bacterium]